MKQTRKVLSFFTLLFIVFFIFSCSEMKNPVNLDIEEYEMPELSFNTSGTLGVRNAVDDIKLIGGGSETVYEDGTFADRWFFEPGASLASVFDPDRGSSGDDVIEFYDNGTNSLFVLGNGADNSYMWNSVWNNTTQFSISWDMKFHVDFVVYVLVDTDDGYKFLYYSSVDNDLGFLAWGNGYVHHGLGANAADGTWRTFTRNLQADLNDGIPNLSINAVHFFKVRALDDYVPPPPSGPFCEDGRKPMVITMQYTGEGCDATHHSQDPDKVSCWGDPDFASPVRIIVTDKEQPFHHKAKVLFDGVVALDETFDIDAHNAGADRLNANTYVSIFDLQGGLLQTIKFHTSCSQPLNIGDQFGSLVLVDGILTEKHKGKGNTMGGKGKKGKKGKK